jgi:hypothetical protein
MISCPWPVENPWKQTCVPGWDSGYLQRPTALELISRHTAFESMCSPIRVKHSGSVHRKSAVIRSVLAMFRCFTRCMERLLAAVTVHWPALLVLIWAWVSGQSIYPHRDYSAVRISLLLHISTGCFKKGFEMVFQMLLCGECYDNFCI